MTKRTLVPGYKHQFPFRLVTQPARFVKRLDPFTILVTTPHTIQVMGTYPETSPRAA